MTYRNIVVFFLIFIGNYAVAQTMTPEQYIERYKDIAIEEMRRSGVPASITLAQGILETESGNSDLVRRSNNHFGIKCKTGWQGESVSHTDDAPNECFRKYASDKDSYADHSDFLKANGRYSSLFTLDKTDYKGWAYGLRKAGYATNPRYPVILITYIERYDLSSLDNDAYDPKMVFAKPVFTDADQATTVVAIVLKPLEIVDSKQVTIDVNAKQFNGLKAVFAKANTSLLAIATQASLSLSRLLEYNDMEKDGLLKESQYIYLEKKYKDSKIGIYTAETKESLRDISQSVAVQLSALALYNDLSATAMINAGQSIKLNKTAELPAIKSLPVSAKSDKAEVSATKNTHTVQPKEGLYGIARLYNVTVQALKDWNNLESDNLLVGQVLQVAK